VRCPLKSQKGEIKRLKYFWKNSMNKYIK